MEDKQINPQKLILVTGGNKGIGFGILHGLLKKKNPNKFILTSRNEELGKASLDKLIAEFPDRKDDLIYHQLDITDKESVDQLFHWIKQNYNTVDIFVNNAAIIAKGTNGDKKVVDETFQTNVYSTVSISERLANEELIARNGKLIIVGSEFGDTNRLASEDIKNILRKEDLTLENLLSVADRWEEAIGQKRSDFEWSAEVYGLSKLIVNTYTRILSKKQVLNDKNIAVYASTPGYTATDLNNNQGYRTLEQGCETPIYVVELPDGIIEEFHGKLFLDSKPHNFDGGFFFSI